MKKTIFLLGLMLSLFGCKKEMKDGGYIFNGIFIINANEELVPAHKYSLSIPAEAATYDLNTVFESSREGRGMFYYFLNSNSDNYRISVLGEPANYPKDTTFDMQTVRIQATENNAGKIRKCTFRLTPDSYMPIAADIVVVQASK